MSKGGHSKLKGTDGDHKEQVAGSVERLSRNSGVLGTGGAAWGIKVMRLRSKL